MAGRNLAIYVRVLTVMLLVALLLPFVVRRTHTFYTDGRTVREPPETATGTLRTVLWERPRPIPGFPPGDHYEPSVGAAGQFLVFTVGEAGTGADLWASHREEGQWRPPRPLTELNSGADDMGACLGVNGQVILFCSNRPGGYGGHDLWYSIFDDDTWSEPRNLGPEVNGPYHEMAAALSPDDGRLLFASDRRLAELPSPRPSPGLREDLRSSQYDLYAVSLEWEPSTTRAGAASQDVLGAVLVASVPVPLDSINRPDSSEVTPAFSPQGDFLYFSSNRPGGCGGFDLYRVRVTGSRLGAVESLGPQVNSPAHELDPVLGAHGFELYFSSSRVGSREVLMSAAREVRLVRQTGETYWSVAAVAAFLREFVVRTEPAIVALLVSVVLCLVFWLLCRGRYGGVSLALRCLLIALAAHLLLAVWMDANRVRRLLLQTLRLGEEHEYFEVTVDGTFEETVALAIRGTLADTRSDDAPLLSTTSRPLARPLPQLSQTDALVREVVPSPPPLAATRSPPLPGPEPSARPVLTRDSPGPAPVEAFDEPPEPPEPAPVAVEALSPAPAGVRAPRARLASSRRPAELPPSQPRPLAARGQRQVAIDGLAGDPTRPASPQRALPETVLESASPSPRPPALSSVTLPAPAAPGPPAPRVLAPRDEARPPPRVTLEIHKPPADLHSALPTVEVAIDSLQELAGPRLRPRDLLSPGGPGEAEAGPDQLAIRPAVPEELSILAAGVSAVPPAAPEPPPAPSRSLEPGVSPAPALSPSLEAGRRRRVPPGIAVDGVTPGVAPGVVEVAEAWRAELEAPRQRPSHSDLLVRDPEAKLTSPTVPDPAPRSPPEVIALPPGERPSARPPGLAARRHRGAPDARTRGEIAAPVELKRTQRARVSSALENLAVDPGRQTPRAAGTLRSRTLVPAPVTLAAAPAPPPPPVLAVAGRPGPPRQSSPRARQSSPRGAARLGLRQRRPLLASPPPPTTARTSPVATVGAIETNFSPASLRRQPLRVSTARAGAALREPTQVPASPRPPSPLPPSPTRSAVYPIVSHAAPPAAEPVLSRRARRLPQVSSLPRRALNPAPGRPVSRPLLLPPAAQVTRRSRPEPRRLVVSPRHGVEVSQRRRQDEEALPGPPPRPGSRRRSILGETRREKSVVRPLLAGRRSPRPLAPAPPSSPVAPSVLNTQRIEASGLAASPTAVVALAPEIRPVVFLPRVVDPASGGARSRRASSRFVPRLYQLRERSERDRALRLGGGTALTEAAVERGLQWLALHQSPDGRWSLRDYASHLDNPSRRDLRHADWHGRRWFDSRGGGGRARSGDAAATALALLCFLGHGETHTARGPYRASVAGGLDWLLSIQESDGDLRGDGNLYMHAIASFALCEAYAFTRDPKLRGPAQRAIDFTVRSQNPRRGGWRYVPYPQSDDVDTSVSGWMLMALKSARLGELRLNDSCLRRAARYLNSVRMTPAGGRYAYQPRSSRTSPAMTAQGLFSQQILADVLLAGGMKKTELRLATAESVDYCLNHLPRAEDQQGVNFYYWYYATLALFQEGGRAWRLWNDSISKLIVLLQLGDEHGTAAGSWDPRDRRAAFGGRVYATTMSILILEVYYRYAPLENRK